MTWPQGDHLVFGPTEEATNSLFEELEMVQSGFFAENSEPVQTELSQEDLEKVLDFTSSEENPMDQSGVRGFSDSAPGRQFQHSFSSPEYPDPVQVSMQEANIFFSNTTTMDRKTNLLQMQGELGTNTEVKGLTSQSSPLCKDITNPQLGSSHFTSTETNPTRFLAPPVVRTPFHGLPRPRMAAAHTTVSPTGSATSVIVRAPNQPNLSLPGSISLHTNHLDGPKVGDKTSLPVMITELATREWKLEGKKPAKAKQELDPEGKYLCFVCGENAGKHSHYGGQACASCRAFFR